MKKFEAPEVEIITFTVEDVITASNSVDDMLMIGENCISEG